MDANLTHISILCVFSKPKTAEGQFVTCNDCGCAFEDDMAE